MMTCVFMYNDFFLIIQEFILDAFGLPLLLALDPRSTSSSAVVSTPLATSGPVSALTNGAVRAMIAAAVTPFIKAGAQPDYKVFTYLC